VVVTDTIPHVTGASGDKLTVLSLAPLYAEAIRRIHSDDSVSSLFR
jgi:ribose-phosphate pyrophosphokinase